MLQRDRASSAVPSCTSPTLSPTPVQLCLPRLSKEVASHAERGLWDLLKVRELSEWMRNDVYSEVLVGRMFVQLGYEVR